RGVADRVEPPVLGPEIRGEHDARDDDDHGRADPREQPGPPGHARGRRAWRSEAHASPSFLLAIVALVPGRNRRRTGPCGRPPSPPPGDSVLVECADMASPIQWQLIETPSGSRFTASKPGRDGFDTPSARMAESPGTTFHLDHTSHRTGTCADPSPRQPLRGQETNRCPSTFAKPC